MKIFVLFFTFFTLSFSAFCQEDTVFANLYFQQNEYQKAIVYFNKLSPEELLKNENLKRYVFCLTKEKEGKKIEKLLSKLRKKDPENIIVATEVVKFYSNRGEKEKVTLILNEFILKNSLTSLAFIESLEENQFYTEAIFCILEKRKKPSDSQFGSAPLARLYSLKGNTEGWIEEVFSEVELEKIESTKTLLQESLKDPKLRESILRTLYRHIQDQPQEMVYPELLLWVFTQTKEFGRAFTQAKSLDKRIGNNGERVFQLAQMASRNQEFTAATKMMEYLVENYKSSFQIGMYRRFYISMKEKEVKKTFPINKDEIYKLIAEYQIFINSEPSKDEVFEAERSIGILYGLYLNDTTQALKIFTGIIEKEKGNLDYLDRVKMDLADLYLITNEIWEANLLYSQVEKTQKENNRGYEAKLKNAKLSYYRGDFELAEEQLSILKNATSREISNDAIELALLIQDNSGYDSTNAELKEYAAIDLLLFQNKINEGIDRLNTAVEKYKLHPIIDELYWLRSKTFIKLEKYKEALEDLDRVMSQTNEKVLLDDAWFLKAKILEENLKEKDKSIELYQEFLRKFPASVYAFEVRNRIRNLRGEVK